MSRYRDHFDERRAAEYDAAEYSRDSPATLLWNLERRQLQSWLDARDFIPRRQRYLDFACGTGRVTRFVSDYFESTCGLDISSAMLTRARSRVPAVDFREVDVIADPDTVRGPFDLITAFRFILNSDEDDRAASLRWMRTSLRDSSSRIIVNNHGHLPSHKLLSPSILRRGGKEPVGNLLSHRQIERMFLEAGFGIERRAGLGLLPGRALRHFRYASILRMEANLPETIRRLGVDQLYVLRPI